MKKLLIVDDNKDLVKRFQSAAKGEFEVHVAYGVREGIEQALKINPDIATIDHDMPDGTGNEVAQKIKEINPDAKIAGFTGGEPEKFKPELFDIRESKENLKNYQNILKILANSPNPAKEYGKLCYKPNEKLVKAIEHFLPIDILVQGYDMALELRAGAQPVPGVELRIPTQEETDVYFEMEGLGIDKAADFYKEPMKIMKEAIPDLPDGLAKKVQDFAAEAETFIKSIDDKNMEAIKQQYNSFHQKYSEVLRSLWPKGNKNG